ncbi:MULTISPECIES: S-layer homology domain-containing protein [unclassified Bilifractor]|uniref:S-layer homology domain-containing protein n=1 Tax=unclassified Bilifractor TaxID=2815795 RepID=UPI003F8E3984
MKRKEIARKLAVVVLSASMLVPMVPVNAFAATTPVEVSDQQKTDNNYNWHWRDAVDAAATAVSGMTDTKGNPVTIDTDEATLQNLFVTAFGTDSTVSKIVLTKGTPVPATTDENGVTKMGTIPVTVTITGMPKLGSTVNEISETYNTEITAAALTAAEAQKDQLAIASKVVKEALENENNYTSVGEINKATVIKIAEDAIAAYNTANPTKVLPAITVSMAADPTFSDSTTTAKGSVAGKVNLKITDKASVDVDFTSTRKALNSAAHWKASYVTNLLENSHEMHYIQMNDSSNHDNLNKPSDKIFTDYYYDGLSASEIEEYINAELVKNDAHLKVSNVVIQDVKSKKSEHGKANGEIYGQFLVTDTTNGEYESGNFKMNTEQSDEEKLDEAGAKAVELAKDADYARSYSRSKAIAATKDEVIAKATEIADNAANAFKVEGILDSNGTKYYVPLDTTVKNTAEVKASNVKVDYTPATVDAEGKAVVTVTYKTLNDLYKLGISPESDAFITKDYTFTLTQPKLVKKAITFVYFHHSLTTKYSPVEAVNSKAVSDQGNALDLSSFLEVSPWDGNDKITYTSSDESVIVMDGSMAIPQGVGTATITATNANDPSVTAKVKISVVTDFQFKDVQDARKYYFQPVYDALRNHITAGLTDDTFGVDRTATRAQMVTWMWRKAGSPVVSTSYAKKFTDVDTDAYYAKAVAWAVKNGITSGTTATTFKPNGTVTRAQMVQFLYKYADGRLSQNYSGNGSFNFTDVSSDAYYYDAVQWAAKYGITAGKTATTFAPNDACTRAQGVTFLSRL